MPGVLQIEAMAQVGGIFALSGVEDPENWSTYFMKIDNVRFKQKVVPGDTVLFQLAIGEPHSPGTGPHDGPGLMWETSWCPRRRCWPRSSGTGSPLLLPHESDGTLDRAIDFAHWRPYTPARTIGEGVSPVSPFAVIGANVQIGCRDMDRAQCDRAGVARGSGPTAGSFPGAVIGGMPQDLKYAGEHTSGGGGGPHHHTRVLHHQQGHHGPHDHKSGVALLADGIHPCGARCHDR